MSRPSWQPREMQGRLEPNQELLLRQVDRNEFVDQAHV
jgi:hypothetical protein